MAVIAGIDEAGLGPVLGPLVVSAVAFRVPDASADECMWRLLSPAVTRKAARKASASIAVADSKKLFNRAKADGLRHLERGVLSMIATRLPAPPASLRALLNAVSPAVAEHMPRYPWYADTDLDLPREGTAVDVSLTANALGVALQQCGMRLESVRCEVLLAGEFNRMVAATRNKSAVTSNMLSRLLVRLCKRWGGEGLRVYIDRQGGRMRYLPELQQTFPGCEFRILDECETCSAYRITSGGKEVEVWFRTECEEQHLPVAMASMTSKYVRELFMTLFNGFWAQHVPDLRPTAGYYTDGRRFYEEIREAMGRLGVDESLVYRSR